MISLVRELEPYSQAELQQIFGADKKSWPGLLKRLDRLNMIRRRSSCNAEELEDSEFAQHEHDEKEYSLSFVGVYVWKRHIVYSLPKYACLPQNGRRYLTLKNLKEHRELLTPLSTIMKVLRRYSKSRVKESLNALSQPAKDDYLALLVHIVTDYADYGPYRDDISEERLNGRGRILWQRTIQTTRPYIQNNRPCYMTPVLRHTVEDRDNFFTRLHLHIVDECRQVLERAGLIELLTLPRIEDVSLPEQDMGDSHYLVERIYGELNAQFDSRRRHILQLMLKYLNSNAASKTNLSDEMVFGNTSFQLVWEEVCRKVLGHDDRQMLNILPPKWEYPTQSGWIQWKSSTKSLEPDIIIKRPDSYWLFDAKYYLPTVQNNSVSKLPGVADITKQFLYQQAFQMQFRSDLVVHNAFLMPTPDDEVIVGNTVTLFARSSMRLFYQLGYIYTYRILPSRLYEAYLHPEKRTQIQEEMQTAIQNALKDHNPTCPNTAESMSES